MSQSPHSQTHSNPLSHSQSREATPASSSSSSQGMSMDQGTSSSASIGTGSQGLGIGSGQDDAERFRKRMELEQTMQTLQQRLKLASMKAENGWTGMSINEIETQLPPPTPKRGRRDMTVSTAQSPVASTSTSSIPYEPPSPSRPWQLIDVLWQPLPPPSHSRNPTSPSSPLKRSRTDDDDRLARRNSNSHGSGSGGGGEGSVASLRGHPGYGMGHTRRASGSATFHPHSPIGQIRHGHGYGDKKRSQSHSHHRLSPTTTQDVDAAKALTEMLSGSPHPSSPGRVDPDLNRSVGTLMHPPAITNSASLPIPPSFEEPPLRPRASSVNPPPNHPQPHNQNPAPDDEDKNAAELMMFLAHSPSPAAPKPRIGPKSPKRSMGSAARVLFADTEPLGLGGKVDKPHSNLVSATPITAATEAKIELEEAPRTQFGGLLGSADA